MLFNPARAVQARELTQLQTVLQEQIASFADHIFKDGSPVIGGQISTSKDNPYIEINATELVTQGTSTQLTNIALMVGRHIKGYTDNTFATETGALAEVIQIDDNSSDATVAAGRLRLHLRMRGGLFSGSDYFRTFDYSDSENALPKEEYHFCDHKEAANL